MFTEKMIAPCGLDCNLCSQAHKKKHACPGCMGSDENKPAFCSQGCPIVRCSERAAHHYRFCDECSHFPCSHLTEIEQRYGSQYVLQESPLHNLRTIREKGILFFLQEEKKQWTCPECGGVISVHNGICSQCRKSVRRWGDA